MPDFEEMEKAVSNAMQERYLMSLRQQWREEELERDQGNGLWRMPRQAHCSCNSLSDTPCPYCDYTRNHYEEEV